MKKWFYDTVREDREPPTDEQLRRNRIGCAVIVVVIAVLVVLNQTPVV